MAPATIFDIQLVLGYVPWLICFGMYFWPRLRTMDGLEAQRAIALLHSFRFFGLIFILPGVVGPALPPTFAAFAAYGDFATGVLAMLALLAIKARSVFWPLVVAYNLVGVVDLVVDYYNGATLGLADIAGQLGAGYVVPIIYVPILMITHIAAFYLLMRSSRAKNVPAVAGAAAVT